jgi:hypothetical protein
VTACVRLQKSPAVASGRLDQRRRRRLARRPVTTAPGRIQSSAEAVTATDRHDPYVANAIASFGGCSATEAIVSSIGLIAESMMPSGPDDIQTRCEIPYSMSIVTMALALPVGVPDHDHERVRVHP